MFDAMQSVQQAGLRLPRSNHHRFLQDDGAVIHLVIHQMDRDPGDLRAPPEGLANRVGAWEGGKEGRMDVEDPPGKAPHKPRGKDAHEAGQTDHADLPGVKQRDEASLKRRSMWKGLGIDERRLDAGTTGSGEGAGFFAVGNDDSQMGLKYPPSNRVNDRLEIGALTGTQHCDTTTPVRSTSYDPAIGPRPLAVGPRALIEGVGGMSPPRPAWSACGGGHAVGRTKMPPRTLCFAERSCGVGLHRRVGARGA